MNSHKLKIIAGSTNPVLATKICDVVMECNGVVDTNITKFADGESQIEIIEDVRGCDVFVVQSTCKPVNDSIIELCLILDALKRSNCWRITAVLPYYGYARQDRKIKQQVPISAKAIANLISISGTDRVVTVDLHAGQIQGFFEVPVDNLYASSVFLKHILSRHVGNADNLVIVAPDMGSTDRAKAYAKRIGCDVAIVYKRRGNFNQIEEMILLGEVEGKDAIIIDDMVDSAGTLVNASSIIMDAGALSIDAYCTHPVLSNPAIERLNKSKFNEVYVTDTISLNEKSLACSKLKVISIASLMGEAIYNIHHDNRLCDLFVI